MERATVTEWADGVTGGAAGETAAAFLNLTLHAHLPYVVNHGTWPHGMEWLHEAAAETYLPLLRMLGRLERDGLGLRCNVNLSPILLEQLAHPVFQVEFPKYVARKIAYAREDEAFFGQAGEPQYAETARFWQGFFLEAMADWERLGGDLIGEFKRLHGAGLIEVMTCAATHGYLPLLGTDESVRAQVRVGVATHERHFGEAPKGVWMPECGYRPAGVWTYPVGSADRTALPHAKARVGVEQVLRESGLAYTFVDTHLVEESEAVRSPYAASVPAVGQGYQSLYHPWLVDGPYDRERDVSRAVAVFPRDPRTGVQVWSGESGYPGDGHYLDFHKKRWPGGHRYWRVTGAGVDMGEKQPYYPGDALGRIASHADHFVALVREALEPALDGGCVPVLCAPFDAELFGHWWFEGVLWLEAVARKLAASEVRLTTCSAYLREFPAGEFLALREGSWGAEGTGQVWLNAETQWTYTHLYPAEVYLREVCTEGAWRESALGLEIVQQMCRELLLLEASDWQFLITTGAARDYAELRFLTHHDQFQELRQVWESYMGAGVLNEHQGARLAAIQERDGVFLDVDPGFWVVGARAV